VLFFLQLSIFLSSEEVDLVQRSSCPPGWSPINNRCFRYVSKPMTWARAERHCLSMGANLASVHDTNEYHQVQSVIKMATYKSDETWIGGTNAQETSIWLWSDGSRLHYTNWHYLNTTQTARGCQSVTVVVCRQALASRSLCFSEELITHLCVSQVPPRVSSLPLVTL
uniref:C-type lectin domain-containing protein n=1 Tax=Fundulus heteroclitus TaxID=8078 RepID=A0A3Q2PHP2_FUNHE